MWLFWLIVAIGIILLLEYQFVSSPKAKGIRLENKIHQILQKLAVKYEGYAF